MFHFAAAITQKAITELGEFFKCFPPFGVDINPENARLYGIMLEVPSDVSDDFDIDVKWNGDTIYAAGEVTFAASSNTQLKQLDLDAPLTTGIISPLIFEEITIEALTLPEDGIPAGMKIVVIFDDGIVSSDGGGDPPPDPTLWSDVTWQDITGATLNGDNSLTKTAAAGWGNSGAWGTEGFPVATGMRIRMLGDTVLITGAISFGISAADSDQSYASADYSFIPYPGGWTCYENGVAVYTTNQNTPWATGDKFEIRVAINGVVTYWFNDVLVYTSTVQAVGTYHADVAMSPQGTSVTPVEQRQEIA